MIPGQTEQFTEELPMCRQVEEERARREMDLEDMLKQ